jgi:hypothetical protein
MEHLKLIMNAYNGMAWEQGAGDLQVACLAYSLNLKIEAISFFETSVVF